jgi:hypothetical protein
MTYACKMCNKRPIGSTPAVSTISSQSVISYRAPSYSNFNYPSTADKPYFINNAFIINEQPPSYEELVKNNNINNQEVAVNQTSLIEIKPNESNENSRNQQEQQAEPQILPVLPQSTNLVNDLE